MPETRNILIYRLGSLGDTVMSLPAFNLLRDHYKADNIYLLTNKPVNSKAPQASAVLGDNFGFKEILTYPVGTRNPGVLLRLLRKVKSLGIDTVVNITAYRSKSTDQRDKLFFRTCGVKNLIGFDVDDEFFNLSNTSESEPTKWEAERILKRLEELGNVDLSDQYFWDLHLTENEIKRADEALGTYALNNQLFAINAGTKMIAKEWGLENWQALIASMSTHLPNAVLVFIGAPDERNFSEQCRELWQGESINLCGVTTPRESAAVLKKCNLLIGHDSGPIHLAGAVGTPVLGIFSCINKPNQWLPNGELNNIIFPETECADSIDKECKNAPNYCVRSIDPIQVENELVNMLQKLVLA